MCSRTSNLLVTRGAASDVYNYFPLRTTRRSPQRPEVTSSSYCNHRLMRRRGRRGLRSSVIYDSAHHRFLFGSKSSHVESRVSLTPTLINSALPFGYCTKMRLRWDRSSWPAHARAPIWQLARPGLLADRRARAGRPCQTQFWWPAMLVLSAMPPAAASSITAQQQQAASRPGSLPAAPP
eukprot:SAG25_NODE_145_length_13941_cov_48.705967_10_plen_180_part_00